MFLSQILLARWMGSFEFGTYVYVWTWLLLVGDIVHLGVPLTAQRFIPEYTQRNQPRRTARLSDRLPLDHVRAATSSSLWRGALLVHALEPSLDQQRGAAALPRLRGAAVLRDVVHARRHRALLQLDRARPDAAFAVAADRAARPDGAGIYAAGYPINAITTMLALVVAIWSTTLVQLPGLNRRLAATIEPGPKRYDVRRWITTALPIIMVWGFYTLLTTTDVLVLQQFRPADEVAHYYAASKTLTLVTFVYFAVSASAAHRFAAYHVAGDRDGLAALVASSVRWIFWPSLAATLLILAFGKPMLWLFGPGFTDGLSGDVRAGDRPDGARRDRAGGAAVTMVGPAAHLRAGLCRGLRGQSHRLPDAGRSVRRHGRGARDIGRLRRRVGAALS